MWMGMIPTSMADIDACTTAVGICYDRVATFFFGGYSVRNTISHPPIRLI